LVTGRTLVLRTSVTPAGRHVCHELAGAPLLEAQRRLGALADQSAAGPTRTLQPHPHATEERR
jgi:hypothetical protein